MDNIKICSNCKKEQSYSTKNNLNRAIKNNTLCKECNLKKERSDSTKLKISNTHKNKPKSNEHRLKLREKNIIAWKRKTKEELFDFAELQSKINKQKSQDINYINKCKISAKSYWDSLTQEQREERYFKSQDGGAGYCKYYNIYNYRVFGKSEKRYIEYIIKNNLELPIIQERNGILTSYGMYFPDFDFGKYYVEIKSLYTFEKLKSSNQLNKIKEIDRTIKPIKIIVEVKNNKFEDFSNLIK
jgi:hypothetical protein